MGMYMMGLGGSPVGECYLSPPDKNGEAWLIGHYYNGGNIKLLNFKPPVEAPEDGSPIKRIEDSEDWHEYAYVLFDQIKELIKELKNYFHDTESWNASILSDLCDAAGLTWSDYESDQPHSSDGVDPKIDIYDTGGEKTIASATAEITATKASRAQWYATSANYMVTNAENMSAQRGW